MRYYIIGLLTFLLIIILWDGCEKKPEIIIKIDTIEVIKHKVDTLEKQVIKWKEQKTKIVYKTYFDTLATIDTVFIELIKCDSIIKIDSVIIAKQDTIIQDQALIIAGFEAEKEEYEHEIKKGKRKLLLTKVLVGAVILCTILFVK